MFLTVGAVMRRLAFCTLVFLTDVMFLQVCSKEAGNNQTITVGSNGKDEKACIQGSHPCLTLSYVFEQLASEASDKIHYIVDVNDDQLMPAEKYEFPPATTMTVRGNGMKRLQVCTDRNDSIIFSSANGSMEWQSFHLYSCSLDSPSQGLPVFTFEYLTFLNCEFSNLVGVIVMYISLFKMDGCNFHDNHDTYFDVFLNPIGGCNISNTTFQRNNLQSTPGGAMFLLHHQHESAIFFNEFHYIENNASSLIDIQAKSLLASQSIFTLQISRSLFKKNDFTHINHLTLLSEPIPSCISIDYVIINSSFVENQVSAAMLVHGESTIQVVCVNVRIHDSILQGNNGPLLLVSAIATLPTSNFTISDTAFYNNSAQDSMISITCMQCYVCIMATFINSTHLTSDDPYAAVVKILYATQVSQNSEKVLISKCAFERNYGTPLAVVAENFPVPITFDSEVIFIGNQGVLS